MKSSLILLAFLCLMGHALAESSVVVVTEGTTDIPMEAYAHDTAITTWLL